MGSATADCKDPTSNLGIARLNFHAGSVEGLTLMPFGLAAAESHGTSIQAIVANPGPSSVPFQVELFFVGSLLATAGPSEVASAGYGFTVERNFTTVSDFTQIHRITCPACGVMSITDSPDAIVAMDVAPPGGVVSYVIDPFVIGQAVTVPEPSTYLLVATGFGILLGGHRWGRRNPRFVTQRAYPLHFAFHLHASRFRVTHLDGKSNRQWDLHSAIQSASLPGWHAVSWPLQGDTHRCGRVSGSGGSLHSSKRSRGRNGKNARRLSLGESPILSEGKRSTELA